MSLNSFLDLRVGQGFDVHALVKGRPLILGGVHIPGEYGLLGHSDADALLHAVTDALLGATGLGDIGRLFPDTDPRYKGADSRVLLRATLSLISDSWFIINIDATIHAQAPKMAPYIATMQKNIADDLSLDPSKVNIKAKTNESLGHIGRQEGIAANAVVLLIKR